MLIEAVLIFSFPQIFFFPEETKEKLSFLFLNKYQGDDAV